METIKQLKKYASTSELLLIDAVVTATKFEKTGKALTYEDAIDRVLHELMIAKKLTLAHHQEIRAKGNMLAVTRDLINTAARLDKSDGT
tara:strand:+ start:13022 stop:13288 length:267 start_codon:yes stop_codon:yes gene_type:complete